MFNANNHVQEGSSAGQLSQVTGFDAGGQILGVVGLSRPRRLNNFGATNTSQGLGGTFASGPEPASTLSLDGTGTYWIGGVRGTVDGRIDGSPGLGAVAGVIGCDNADPTSTAPHFAGYFDGDVFGTRNSEFDGDLRINGGNFFIDSPGNPGRVFEFRSGIRQEVHTVNDYVTFGGGNIEFRPGINSGNANFTVADAFGQKLFLLDTVAQTIGIGTTTAIHPLEMGSGAHVSAAGVWTDASSREYKENIRKLTIEEATSALEKLCPSRFNYKIDKTDEYVGFIAEDVPDLVATKDRKGLSPMDIVGVLTRVVQEQQRQMRVQEEKLESLSEQVKAMNRSR